jgi:hypothetical protein
MSLTSVHHFKYLSYAHLTKYKEKKDVSKYSIFLYYTVCKTSMTAFGNHVLKTIEYMYPNFFKKMPNWSLSGWPTFFP